MNTGDIESGTAPSAIIFSPRLATASRSTLVATAALQLRSRDSMGQWQTHWSFLAKGAVGFIVG
jgi:hypothetical protein